MKIGLTCNKLCRIEQAAKYGFDYLEVSLKWLQTLSPEELAQYESYVSYYGSNYVVRQAMIEKVVRVLVDGVVLVD